MLPLSKPVYGCFASAVHVRENHWETDMMNRKPAHLKGRTECAHHPPADRCEGHPARAPRSDAGQSPAARQTPQRSTAATPMSGATTIPVHWRHARVLQTWWSECSPPWSTSPPCLGSSDASAQDCMPFNFPEGSPFGDQFREFFERRFRSGAPEGRVPPGAGRWFRLLHR